LRQTKGERHKIGFYVGLNEKNTSKLLSLKHENLIGKSNFSSKKSVSLSLLLDIQENRPYSLIPSCFNFGETGEFEIIISIKNSDSSNPKAAIQVYPSNVVWYSTKFEVNFLFFILFFLFCFFYYF
jgi:hypothetical protein